MAPPLTGAFLLGRDALPPPPYASEIEPPMLPPYGWVASPRFPCFSPLLMLSACLGAASLLILSGVDRWHGVVDALGSGDILGQGVGPWDDVAGYVKRAIHEPHDRAVDVDMRARRAKVEEWMIRPQRPHLLLHRQEQNHKKRRTQSEYWPYRYPESSDA